MDENKNIDCQGAYMNIALGLRILIDDMRENTLNARKSGNMITIDDIYNAVNRIEEYINVGLSQVSNNKIKINHIGSNNI